jgi:hypothetical protein
MTNTYFEKNFYAMNTLKKYKTDFKKLISSRSSYFLIYLKLCNICQRIGEGNGDLAF